MGFDLRYEEPHRRPLFPVTVLETFNSLTRLEKECGRQATATSTIEDGDQQIGKANTQQQR